MSDLFLEKLNNEQLEAVKCTEGPLLILAGAGSGKTKVIINRISYLINHKRIKPWKILAITFTNKAAQEMRIRLSKLIGDDAEKVTVSTFHAFCARVLRTEIEQLGFGTNYVIFDSADQNTLLRQIISELNLDDKLFSAGRLNNKISAWKSDGEKIEELEKTIFSPNDKKDLEIYREYQKRLKLNNALDFDDLLNYVVDILSRDSSVLDKYLQRYDYIHVDEYQDTNRVQYELVRLLTTEKNNICVVGDDDQSIYQWRGADIRNILGFENDFPSAKLIKLEQNYRSTGNILEAANCVVAANKNRKAKKLWTDNTKGEKLFWFSAKDGKKESNFIAETIKSLIISERKSFGDFAILCRITAQFRALEEGLIHAGIPYKVIGGLRFFDRKEIKDIMAYLRVIENEKDEVSLQRIVNTPRRGIGLGSIQKINNFALNNELSFYDGLNSPEKAGINSGIANKIHSFNDLLKDFKARSKSLRVDELIEYIIGKTEYRDELKRQAESEIDFQTRLENIQELIGMAKEYESDNEGGNLSQFLTEKALITAVDNYDNEDEAVSVMTIHAAKGLEFPVVFLTGMEEGIFPHARNSGIQENGEEEKLEEERRLCYVAITRAKEKLFLTSVMERYIYGYNSHNSPSRFIQEIPDNLLNKKEEAEVSYGYGRSRYSGNVDGTAEDKKMVNVKKASPGSFSIGEKVFHAKYGEGIIVQVKNKNEDEEVHIAFQEGHGIKNFITKYAPLKKI